MDAKTRKARWLDAKRPNVNPEKFLDSFQGFPPPVDVNEDGFVDKKELMDKMAECGGSDPNECEILIDSYFDVLDPQGTGKVRTDIFERTYVRMGQYNAISWIKQLYQQGDLNMFTLQDGKADVFFTKEELKQAFMIQIGLTAAARQVDGTFSELDHDSSSYVSSSKLKNWYFSSSNADLRTISLRLRARTVSHQGASSVQHSVVLEQIERQVAELLKLTSVKSKKEKKKLKRKNSPENVLLNRLVNRLHGIHDFMQEINVLDENGVKVFDSTVSDAIMVPIREAYRLGAVDPNAPPPTEEEESD